MSIVCLQCNHSRYISRGSLYKAIKQNVFSDSVTKRIIREVLLGLKEIHEKGIIHRYDRFLYMLWNRDIKADNILIDDNNNIKIADFGISMINNQSSEINETNYGSCYWMAPERVAMQPNTSKSDIW